MIEKGNKSVKQLSKVPRHGFLALLISQLSLLLIPAYFPPIERALFLVVLMSAILLSSLYLVAYKKREFVIGVLLIIPTLASSWLGYIVSSSILENINGVLVIIFLSYIVFHLARYLFETNEISQDMIYASMCLYLMLGLIWAFIYFSIEINSPGSFSISNEDAASANNPRLLLSQFSYYSYVTLSTLGYGDITPITRVPRAWAVLESMIGQFYLAIVVARLVSLHISSTKH